WENAFISPLFDNENNITHFVAVKEDITEKKKMLEELITARDKAEEMNRVKSLFFANMSHELRTPFVAIMGFSELLYETLENPEHKEMAEGIMNTSNRMLATLTKILNLTKSEFEKETALQSEVDMIRLIEDIYRQFSVAAARKNVKLLKNIKFDELVMHTDGNLVSEILNNLVNNSLKFTEKGSIEISAQIIIKEKKDILELKVTDTGIGIPKDKQDLIWEEFRQASEGTTRTYQGTGLGLTIVRRYAEILGGRTYVESEEMKGAAFIVELPLSNYTEKVIDK
ncbi:MAG: HAMP domain-containing histidine kinase, partial [Ignavibacteria bacterium]|nr:HAMP domain-containing histidine kinase [Ignavibacteria bacterium]